jgi:hypothetical protein
MRSKAARQAWWASLTSAEKAAYVERKTAQREGERAAHPSYAHQEANARLDLATERGCLMRDIPAADVAERIRNRRTE